MREKFIILLQEFDQTEILDTKNNIERLRRMRSINIKKAAGAFPGVVGNLAFGFKRPGLGTR